MGVAVCEFPLSSGVADYPILIRPILRQNYVNGMIPISLENIVNNKVFYPYSLVYPFHMFYRTIGRFLMMRLRF